MAQIPVDSKHVIEIIENGSKVELILKNGFKFICNKTDFSNYGAYKASVQQGRPGKRNKNVSVRSQFGGHRSFPFNQKRNRENKIPKSQSPQEGTGGLKNGGNNN